MREPPALVNMDCDFTILIVIYLVFTKLGY
ncbi:MAG: hypothetical protein K0S23_866 [Fluviicola sp.]|jgi:hypothetical protein|nr:hypothetical protein [Fluviicola sp.]